MALSFIHVLMWDIIKPLTLAQIRASELEDAALGYQLVPVCQHQRVEQRMLFMIAVIAHLHALQRVMHQRDALVEQQLAIWHGIVTGNDGLLSCADGWVGYYHRSDLGVPLKILIPAVRGGIQ